MQQSQTILNYLNGNYLLSTNQENQIITIEYESQFYYQCYNLLNYQLYNHINSSRPLLVIDLEYNFEKQVDIAKDYLNNAVKEEKNGFIKYSNNVYRVTKSESLANVLEQIENDKAKSLEVLYKGVELCDGSLLKEITQIQSKPFKSQITLLLPKEFKQKELKTIFLLSNCRIIIDQLQESTEKVISKEKEYKLYNLLTTMVLKKSNGHSFLKTYIIDGSDLHKKKLKINKIKKVQEPKESDIDITQKVGASFNLTLSEQQKQMKAEVDNQINPYKNIMSSDNAPLLYQTEGDEKRIVIDDDQEDFEELEEYEG